MTTETTHLLKVFLCHASGDKPPVRELYRRLVAEGVDAWLDQERLLPGQDWRLEIPRAVQGADVVVICLSKKSITKEGYVQKEIKFALDIAEEKPEGTIFLIPARLEECTVPERLSRWQWVDLYEENGFIRLLRSLKLRADAVGASIEPTLYEDSDKEREKRIKQLYTEGLAAYYTEDWDKACHRFQSILSEQPNHKNAAEKLAEADRQRNLSKLYEQASQAVQSEDWTAAIQTLEELSEKSANYKDAAQLLRNARKQEQLRELYAEVKTLHEAQKWEAVVRVFDQISAIDPNYGDTDGLLHSAQREVAELQRLAELNDLYSRGVEEMDAGHWYEARRLLEQVHKSETGFLETEKLLKKVEEEIAREEEKRRQSDQINTLYEQAHGLLRSKKWRNALEKMGEIRKLDEQFPDTDGIAEQAKKELALEEQEADRQNKLAALYAEAVKLLKDGKYQEALDKWGEVRAIDPRYPDRQRVHNTARKALSKQVKPISTKPRFVMPKSIWIGLGGIGAIAVLVFAINQFGNGENKASLVPTIALTDVVVENTTLPVPTATNVPQKTSTPRPTTAIPTTSGYSDPTMYDDFSGSGIDKTLWDADQGFANAVVRDGYLVLGSNVLEAKRIGEVNITKPYFVESRFQSAREMTIFVWFNDDLSVCQTYQVSSKMHLLCKVFINGKENVISAQVISQESWNIVRIEIEPFPLKFTFFVNGTPTGSYKTDNTNSRIIFGLGSGCKETNCYFDYVRIGAIEDDPTVYDSFNNTTYDGRFNPNLWWYDPDAHSLKTESVQQDGLLVITQSGIDQGSMLALQNYWGRSGYSNMYFEASFKVEMSSDGVISLGILDLGSCGLHTHSDWVDAFCSNSEYYRDIRVTHGSWNAFRIEIDVDENLIRYFINGELFGENRLDDLLKSSIMHPHLGISSGTNRVENTRPVIAFVDNVRVGPLEYVTP